MKKIILLLSIAVYSNSFAQKTDVSLFLKRDKEVTLDNIASKSGNMFHKLGHHGPAIENVWFGLRIYFNKEMSVDVYSKSRPGLELHETRWYPSKVQQTEGWGADYYRAGSTVGLGGIRLWDGEKAIRLHPVSRRTARVVKQDDLAYMEVLSEGISYKGESLDVLVKITVFADERNAKVEASTLSGKPVQFVTGINYHEGQEIKTGKKYIAAWGLHPEDVAIEKVEVGAALLYDEKDFSSQIDDGKQHLLISKKTNHIEIWVTSANAREPELNTFEKFIEYLEN